MAVHNYFIPILMVYVINFALCGIIENNNSFGKSKDKCSRSIQIGNKFYYRENEIPISGIPYDLSVSWMSDTIFMALSTSKGWSVELLKKYGGGLRRVPIDTSRSATTRLDRQNNDMYVIGNNKIYKYNEDSDHVKLIKECDENINFFDIVEGGRTFIVATLPNPINKVKKCKIDEDSQWTEFAAIPDGHGLTLDKENNIYFVSNNVPHILKNNEETPTKIQSIDRWSRYSIHPSGAVFAIDEDSNIYSIIAETGRAELLGNCGLTSVSGFSIDRSGNIVVGQANKIHIFQELNKNPCRSEQTAVTPSVVFPDAPVTASSSEGTSFISSNEIHGLNIYILV